MVQDKTKEDLKQLLENAGAIFQGNKTRCVFPDHADKNASAGIYEKDGKWRYFCQRCQKGGDYYDMDLELGGNGFKNQEWEGQKKYTLDEIKKLGETSIYKSEDGKTELIICRSDKQKANPFTPYGNVFVNKFPNTRPLMNKPTIKESSYVLVVEGEKCVKWAHSIGIPATTSSGGSGSPSKTDWSPLKNKEVIIWPDLDEAGEKYAKAVKEIVLPIAKSVSIIDPSELGLDKGEDIVEFIQNFGAMDKAEIKGHILQIMHDAHRESPSSHYLDYVERAVRGEFKSLKGPYPYLQDSKYLLAGTATTICANGGTGKSFFICDIFNYLSKSGVNCGMYMLEEDIDYWISRCISQVKNIPQWVDPDWMALPHNAKRIAQVINEEHDYINQLSKSIKTPLDNKVTHGDVLAWLKEKSEEGCKFLVVDPVTAISHETNKQWEEDLRFVLEAKRIAKKHNNCIFFVTHPKSGNAEKFTLDSMAGSMAYNRFMQNIIWLMDLDEGEYEITSDGDPYKTELLNKAVIFLKGRNNKMKYGNMVGFEFKDLRFIEKGPMTKPKGKK